MNMSLPVATLPTLLPKYERRTVLDAFIREGDFTAIANYFSPISNFLPEASQLSLFYQPPQSPLQKQQPPPAPEQEAAVVSGQAVDYPPGG